MTRAAITEGKQQGVRNWAETTARVTGAVNTYLDASSQALRLAGQAAPGLSPLIKEFAAAQDKLSAVQNVAAAYLSGNPVAMLGSIGGMFGDGASSGPSGFDQLARHLDEQFDRVLEGQKEIRRAIEELLADEPRPGCPG